MKSIEKKTPIELLIKCSNLDNLILFYRALPSVLFYIPFSFKLTLTLFHSFSPLSSLSFSSFTSLFLFFLLIDFFYILYIQYYIYIYVLYIKLYVQYIMQTVDKLYSFILTYLFLKFTSKISLYVPQYPLSFFLSISHYT